MGLHEAKVDDCVRIVPAELDQLGDAVLSNAWAQEEHYVIVTLLGT